jgi:hypothetical protein
MKLRLRLAILLFLSIVSACATLQPIKGKTGPEYVGVAVPAQSLVDDYLTLAREHGLTFHNKVTLGFSHIPEENIIGWCSYGRNFREIDLDVNYWNASSAQSKKWLLWHELSHCYCNRDHDYGQGKPYRSNSPFASMDIFPKYYPARNTEGYFDDMCPLSIMHPVHVDDDCAESHYQHYVDEMFDRCDPY